MQNNGISILILSCDKYSCLWDNCINRIKKYINKDIDIYLLTNHLNYNKCNKVKIISIGEDLDWSSNLLLAIERINTKYVLLWMDDVFLNKKIETKNWENLLNFINSNHPDFVNLKSTPLKFYKRYINGWQLIPKKTLYRVSVVPNIWKLDVLKELLIKGENAWDFERKGSFRSDKFEYFYISNKKYFNYIHVIYKGQVFRKAYRLLKKSNEIDVIMNHFKIMNIKDDLKLKLKQVVYRLINILPFDLRSIIYKYKL